MAPKTVVIKMETVVRQHPINDMKYSIFFSVILGQKYLCMWIEDGQSCLLDIGSTLTPASGLAAAWWLQPRMGYTDAICGIPVSVNVEGQSQTSP